MGLVSVGDMISEDIKHIYISTLIHNRPLINYSRAKCGVGIDFSNGISYHSKQNHSLSFEWDPFLTIRARRALKGESNER